MSRTAACALLIAAFSSSSAPPPAPAPAVDAGVVDGITTIGMHDPSSGRHLDEGGTGRVPPRPKINRPSRPIEITLKTQPQGADVRIDGVLIGQTPKFWFGESDGNEHEFTFTRSGYAIARFRFVPVQSGIIHAQLVAIGEDNPDAGINAQVFPPDASVPLAIPIDASVAPPETVLSVDAAPAPVDTAPVAPRGPEP
ncbi:MAG: hypothetical protein WKG01_02415 [Kofleriaceae bacterium]